MATGAQPPKKAKPRKCIINYIAPSEKHTAFHNAWKDAPVRILCGGYGSGKSHSACFEILRHLLDNPMFVGKKALVVGLTASHCREQLIPEFKKILTYERKPGQNAGYVEGKDYIITYSPTLKITLPRGSEIIFKSLEAGSNLAGFNVAIAFADEIDKVQLDTWNEVQNRVRDTAGGFTIGTCNPSNKSHWLYERYFQFFDEHGVPPDGTWLEYLTMYDNPAIKHKWADYEKQYGYSNLERERALMGRFVSMQGCVYNGFDRERHTKERDQINIGTEWEVNAGVDFGFKDPTACLWVARTPENKFVVFREHYEAEKTISYHAGIIKSGTNGQIKKPAKIYSDHYSETVQTYREHGVDLTLADKGKGSIYQGISLIAQLLADDRLLITRNCTSLIREFETYQYNPRTNEPLDKNNHALDALRYVLTEMEGKPGFQSFFSEAPLSTDHKSANKPGHDEITKGVFIGYDINGNEEYLPLPTPNVPVANEPVPEKEKRVIRDDGINRNGNKVKYIEPWLR